MWFSFLFLGLWPSFRLIRRRRPFPIPSRKFAPRCKRNAGSKSELVSTGFEGAAAPVPGGCWTLPVLSYETPARCDARSSVAQFRLFKPKSGRTDCRAVNRDIDAICARPECAGAQVIDVLAIIDPEV